MTDVLLSEVDSDVALLTLNRPERLNAWTAEMQTAYFDALEDCAARADVRVIVLTGAGRGFCAGADMANLQAIAGEDVADANGGFDSRPVSFPLSIPKPVIAAINGPVAGIGIVHALMCDIRIVADGAKLTTAFAQRGLIAEHGISWILPRLIGPARALDLLLSARVIRGQEAAAMGLVNRVVEDGRVVEEALAYARALAQQSSPTSMATIKRQVYADLDRGLPETVAEANRLMFESFSVDDFAEGVQSFVEKRPPRFAAVSEASRAASGA